MASDTERPPRFYNTLLQAITFFTILPSTASYETEQSILPYSPIIGIGIGSIGGAVIYLTSLYLSSTLAAILGIVATTALTGALHEDGLADMIDGFGAGWNKQQVLTIMKDTTVGVYGALSLIFITFIKIESLRLIPHSQIIPLLILAHTASRYGITIFAHTQTYQRDKDHITDTLSWKQLGASTVIAGLPLLFTIQFVSIGLMLILLYILTTTVITNRINGYTGDCLGGLQQLLETATYLIGASIL